MNSGHNIKSLCVFCGASNDVDRKYIKDAEGFGRILAENNIRLVYGGGDSGLMGAVANSVLKEGGRVTGVFPAFLNRFESEHKSLTEMILVDDMHTRKWRMFQESDGFVILPGGFGTLDETFEIITWKLLGVHNKPVVLYNHDGYYDDWVHMTGNIIAKGFARKQSADLYRVVSKLAEIIPLIEKEMFVA